MSLQFGGVIFPDATLEAAIRLNGRVDGKAGKDKDDGWKELCQEMGWDGRQQRLCHERYDDGWYDGALEKQKAA